MVPEPLRLKDAFKQYKHDQDKIITPEKTVERFKQRLAESDLSLEGGISAGAIAEFLRTFAELVPTFAEHVGYKG